ncbi:enoyl-CoA hydratase/isomerase family protein [Thermomonospora umbrina]|uniref:Enoyl-CoA hydratase/carnithine racemase n=1 Tax=Thermomonospora umbrina TaxID=111806 RepID=A0A3D9SNT7_9ACTN|nr:enoyl-CoA hydratase/isomerase family protein [Thermomonospora umbrina]REE97622.1 enoyl-CoA hydratase/carnithine racemase [Thermomonospora umbrina]
MSGDPALRSATVNGVATITIDRPNKRNAITAAMWRELPRMLDALRSDPEVRVLVLTGAGGHFSSGADIGELADIAGGDLAVPAERALAAFPKPTVAAVQGFCVGGGCQLAAACDLRLAADDARFGITPAKIGIVYPGVPTARLVRLIGPAAAKYLLFSGDLVDAPHALRIGLVDEVVPADRLPARLAEFTATLAARSQLTLQAAKDLIDAAAAGTLTEERATTWEKESRKGIDAAEGIAAFLERRPPKFTWSGRGGRRR